MNFWKYFDITHKDHKICNPISSKKLDELLDVLKLGQDSRVLDIAFGKAEFIIRLVKNYNVSAIGIDLSPFFVREAAQRVKEAISNSDVQLIEMDGASYKPDMPESFDMASCLGASWIFGDHEGTLKYLMKQVKPGGLVLAGEPYWKLRPPEEYFKMAKNVNSTEDFRNFGSHYENVSTGERLGLSLVYCLVSNADDWDKYMNLQWNAADKYLRANPDDPDIQEIMEKLNKEKELYLKWERKLLGWAIYVFRK